jgi:hypothetical protein
MYSPHVNEAGCNGLKKTAICFKPVLMRGVYDPPLFFN